MTFQSSRNAASNALHDANLNLGSSSSTSHVRGERQIRIAELYIALAQAEAFHELASSVDNVAGALGRLQR